VGIPKSPRKAAARAAAAVVVVAAAAAVAVVVVRVVAVMNIGKESVSNEPKSRIMEVIPKRIKNSSSTNSTQ